MNNPLAAPGDELAVRRVLPITDAYFDDYLQLMDQWKTLQRQVRRLGVPLCRGNALVSPKARVLMGVGAARSETFTEVWATLGGNSERIQRAQRYTAALATGCRVVGGADRAYNAMESAVVQYTIWTGEAPHTIYNRSAVVGRPSGSLTLNEVSEVARHHSRLEAIKHYTQYAADQEKPIREASQLLMWYMGPAPAA